jgi:DNA (cytosine-5)-methyltransferase 1
MKYFSLFTGIGGFELGIEKAYVASNNRGAHGKREKNTKTDKGQGLVSAQGEKARTAKGRRHELPDGEHDPGAPDCVGYSEIDPYAIKIYQKHFNHKNYGDITKIKEKELPEFDLLVGGFPCQSFSIAGQRKGFADTRGTLFFDIARIIKAKRPRLLLLENVKGLLSHDEGRTFRTIITALDELGYDIQWQVLNSKNFGVPQNRERVYIVGNLRGTPRPEVFPLAGENETFAKALFVDESNYRREGKIREYQGQSPTLNTAGGGGHLPLILQKGRGKNKGGEHKIAPTLTGKSYQDNNHLISKTVRAGGRASPHGSKQNWDTYEVDGTIRRLTPIECERLQGFPDNWTKTGSIVNDIGGGLYEASACIISDAQRYKTLGNAVTTNVVQAVMCRMLG